MYEFDHFSDRELLIEVRRRLNLIVEGNKGDELAESMCRYEKAVVTAIDNLLEEKDVN